MNHYEENILIIEREKIARHLHDVVANELLHFQFMFLKIEHNIDKDTFVKMSDRLNYIRKQIRNISHELITPSIDNDSENIIELIKTLLVDYTYLLNNITFDFNFFPKFIDTKKYDTFQIIIIIKELINNAVNYSNAKNIDINITEHNDNLTIIIEDNGIGFNKKEKKGSGINNIKTRVKQLGGKMNFESTTGKGSVFIIKLLKNESFNS